MFQIGRQDKEGNDCDNIAEEAVVLVDWNITLWRDWSLDCGPWQDDHQHQSKDDVAYENIGGQGAAIADTAPDGGYTTDNTLLQQSPA